MIYEWLLKGGEAIPHLLTLRNIQKPSNGFTALHALCTFRCSLAAIIQAQHFLALYFGALLSPFHAVLAALPPGSSTSEPSRFSTVSPTCSLPGLLDSAAMLAISGAKQCGKLQASRTSNMRPQSVVLRGQSQQEQASNAYHWPPAGTQPIFRNCATREVTPHHGSLKHLPKRNYVATTLRFGSTEVLHRRTRSSLLHLRMRGVFWNRHL